MAETTVESAVADAENAPDRELAQEDANGAAPTANPIVEEEGKPDDSSEPLEVENARSASLDEPETLKEEERNEGEVEVAAVVIVSSSEIVEEEPASAEEDNQTLTMRELLSDLAEEQAVETSKDEENKRDANVSYSPDPDYASTDLINNVSELNEEGRSRQRILTFAARRYAAAIERNPEDHDAYYNWALVLQESADNVDPDSSSTSKDALLEEACRKYDKATRLCPTLQDAFYNWAIAISDRAKIRGRTKQAEELWKEATQKYEKAIQLNWNSPQALNNWGLALQELSAIVPIREKQMIVKNAINKFRAAIELQFDFHRAIYNLGTVLYALAEDTSRIGRPANSKDLSPDELYSQSAIYIAAAHALKPTYSVYRSALKLVRSMLPLPYLKVGYLTAPPLNNPLAPHRDWERAQFVLNHEGIQQVVNAESKALSHSRSGRINGSITSDKALIKIDVADIVSVSPCSDLTLPPGAGLSIDTIHSPFFLVADSWESLDGWLDAIRLVYTIYARGQSDDLAGIITG